MIRHTKNKGIRQDTLILSCNPCFFDVEFISLHQICVLALAVGTYLRKLYRFIFLLAVLTEGNCRDGFDLELRMLHDRLFCQFVEADWKECT